MALPASDNYNRVDAATLGANYTVLLGAFAIQGNQARSDAVNTECGAIWNQDTFAADQWAEATLTTSVGGDGVIGVLVRGSGSGATAQYYSYYAEENVGYLAVTLSGNWSQIGSNDGGWAAGDLMRLEVEGTTLRVYRNGSLLRTVTNTQIASGSAGVSGYNASSNHRIDNWSAGNLSSAVPLVAALGGTGGLAAALTVEAGSVPLAAALAGQGDMAAALSVSGGGSVALSAALSGAGGLAAALTVETPGTVVPTVTIPTGAPEYYVRWKSSAGITRAILAGATGTGGRNGFLGLNYRKEINRPGRFSLVVPFELPALPAFADKDQVEIWRRHRAAGLDWYCDFYGVFRNEDLSEGEQGRITVAVSGPGALSRLDWYHILWPAGVANRTAFTATKAETVLKTLVTRNAVAASATVAAGRDRQAPDYGIVVATDAAGGNTISWNAGQRSNLLTELGDIRRIAGLDFDLIKTGANTWEFRTYALRGADKRATLVFARERGNLSKLRYTKTREGERTAAIVGGEGEGTIRRIRTRTGTTYGAVNDIETFVDARQLKVDAELDAAGDAALEAARARDVFGGELLQTEATRYGPSPAHFELGDLATVFYPRVGAVVQQISAIEVSYTPGQGERVKGEFTTR